MIYFTTEFEINLPLEKESSAYQSKIVSIIEDFLGDLAYKYKDSIKMKYVCGRIQNKFLFNWNNSLFMNDDRRDDPAYVTKQMEKYLKSNSYLKKHNISHIATEYTVKK